MTIGFLHETWDRGIQDMTSVRLTHRHVLADRYIIDRSEYDYSAMSYAQGREKVLFEVLDYKTNATWTDVLAAAGEDNFPVLTEDYYGRGKFLILNIPENFADLYRLPAEVLQAVNAEIAYGLPAYLGSGAQMSLIAYDNEAVCIHSFRPMLSEAKLIVRGACRGVQDLASGKVYTDALPLPAPHHRNDGAKTREAETELAYSIRIAPGSSVHLKILR